MKPKEEVKSSFVGCFVTNEMRNQVYDIAEDRDRSMSFIVREAIDATIKKNTKKKGTK